MVPLIRNTRARIIIIIPSRQQAMRVQVISVISQALVPMRIINIIGEVEQLGGIVVKKVTVVLPAHMVCHWMRVDDVNLAERGSDSTDVTVGICIVCVIIMCLLGSGFASEEHR